MRPSTLHYLTRIIVLLSLTITSIAIQCGRQYLGKLCPASQCCSTEGTCGTGSTFCGKGCQSGPCIPIPCDKNVINGTSTPMEGLSQAGSTAGTTTSSTKTAVQTTNPNGCTGVNCLKKMTVQVDSLGQILSCAYYGVISITYDDGPSIYTNKLLDTLKANNLHVTFYINGYHFETNPELAATLKRAYDEGHQIASHTYSHPDLAKLTPAQIRDEMTKNEQVIYNILGVVPKFMRCPYGSITTAGAAELTRLGYKMIFWNLDTLDWSHPDNPGASLAVYTGNLTDTNVISNSFISLQHDIVQSTVDLAQDVYNFVTGRGMVIMPTSQCLGVTDLYWNTLPSATR